MSQLRNRPVRRANFANNLTWRVSRRLWLARAPALGGLVLTGCSRDTFIPPRVRGPDRRRRRADDEHQSPAALRSAARLRERHRRPVPEWNQTNPKNPEYQRHLAEGFKHWQLPISGLVARPIALSLDQIRGLAARTQITAHVCEQG